MRLRYCSLICLRNYPETMKRIAPANSSRGVVMNIRFSVALIIIGVSSLIQAQEGQVRLSPSEINALANVNAGAGTSGVSGIQTRTLKGDATKPGIYTIQLTIPANVRIEAHTHPDDRVATVISGVWYIGYGAKFDYAKLKPLTAGSFYTEPPSVAHFAKTGNEPVVLQITGNGPTGTEYVDAGTARVPAKPNYDSLFASVNGVRLHYLMYRSGKTPMVVINRLGDDDRMMLPHIAD